MRVHATVACGMALLAIVVGLVLTRSPTVRGSTNGASNEKLLEGHVTGNDCQSGETVPPDTSAIRMSIEAFVGPRMTIRVLSDGRVLDEGHTQSGWTGDAFTVPLRHTTTAQLSDVTVCSTAAHAGIVTAFGSPSPGASAATDLGKRLSGRVRIDYLKPGHRSWLSQLLPVVRHMGLGRAGSGSWIVVLLFLLMAGAAGVSLRVILRELG